MPRRDVIEKEPAELAPGVLQAVARVDPLRERPRVVLAEPSPLEELRDHGAHRLHAVLLLLHEPGELVAEHLPY